MDQWTPANVGALVTILGVVIVNIITSIHNGKKLAVIEAHVNGQKSADNSQIQILANENQLLKRLAAENKEIASLLASKLPTTG